MVLLIFAFQSHTPTNHRVIGKEVSITCQLLSSSTSNNLEIKALGIHGICRLISKITPQLPAVVPPHRPLTTQALAAWRIAQPGAITGLFEVYRRNSSSSSRVIRCRVREKDIGCNWSARFLMRVWCSVIGHAPDHLAPSAILVASRIPSHALCSHNLHNLQPKGDDLSIFETVIVAVRKLSKNQIGWMLTLESHQR